MSDNAFDRLCEAYGLQLAYRSASGDTARPSAASRAGVLRAMGIPCDDDAQIAQSLARAPLQSDFGMTEGMPRVPDDARCHRPDWLEHGRAWGVTCQLYGVRSNRNHGIGDFEDLARLAEMVARDGADFLGVNPLHALFTAAPERCSPFSPSSRDYLNPLYIALDAISGIREQPHVDPQVAARLRTMEWVDYRAVAELKLGALRTLWQSARARSDRWHHTARKDFARFVEQGGTPLRHHALFEALSHHFAAGEGAGWHGWPAEFRQPDSADCRAFAAAHDDAVDFHLWLQWVADRQLARAAERAKTAGMRIGLYLDVAVGTAPDGSATWSDPDLVVPGAHLGAPPDDFFSAGQDWGLAPFSPAALRERDHEPLRRMLDASARHAGAIRIDHAMSLYRLYWIAADMPPSDGCFVRYPQDEMLGTLCAASRANGAIVIGEDLGTVPEGFDTVMREARLCSYRVLYFETVRGNFRAAASWKRNALVSASTHDLPPLAGWWTARDVTLFHELGLLDAAAAQERRVGRARERGALLDRLRRDLPRRYAVDIAATDGRATQQLAVAAHAFLARTPSRLLGVQLEDLYGTHSPVNVPGTWREYRNWQLRGTMPIEIASQSRLWRAIIDAVAQERPKSLPGSP